nr:MAG TPA: hypothetical protein [Caudoviricetes sp.]
MVLLALYSINLNYINLLHFIHIEITVRFKYKGANGLTGALFYQP